MRHSNRSLGGLGLWGVSFVAERAQAGCEHAPVPSEHPMPSVSPWHAASRSFSVLGRRFSPLISDEALAQVINKEPSRLPIFRYAGPRLHHRQSTVMLGDAVHTVKPYFGLGVNAAFEDVAALGQALDEKPSTAQALEDFSRRSGRPPSKASLLLS